MKTRANTAQESLDLLEAMQMPLTKPCENMRKYRSGVSERTGSHANTSHGMTYANTAQESLDILEVHDFK